MDGRPQQKQRNGSRATDTPHHTRPQPTTQTHTYIHGTSTRIRKQYAQTYAQRYAHAGTNTHDARDAGVVWTKLRRRQHTAHCECRVPFIILHAAKGASSSSSAAAAAVTKRLPATSVIILSSNDATARSKNASSSAASTMRLPAIQTNELAQLAHNAATANNTPTTRPLCHTPPLQLEQYLILASSSPHPPPHPRLILPSSSPPPPAPTAFGLCLWDALIAIVSLLRHTYAPWCTQRCCHCRRCG
jgi:hypothetical protein